MVQVKHVGRRALKLRRVNIFIMSLAKIEAECSSPKEAQLNLKGTCTPYKKEKNLQELGKGIISGKTCIWKHCSYCAKDIY